MKRTIPLTGLLVLAAAFAAPVLATTVVFQARIDAAQETPASTSPAWGTATMIYTVETNTFDLVVNLHNFTETLGASHVHEAPAGASGPVKTSLGGEAAYKRTAGKNLHARFNDLTYGGDPTLLLGNGAYVNFHTATFPAGAIRGQLIARPVYLLAWIDGSQEVPPTASDATGLAVIAYDPGVNEVSLWILLQNFSNPLMASHIHEAPPGVNGPVVTNLGSEAAYIRAGDTLVGTFSGLAYGGDPIALLTGGAYVNFHTATHPGGEIRGQILP